MALDKQGVNIPFGQGIETKTDPKQVPLGKFLSLNNSIFANGLLQKRSGFNKITNLPTGATASSLCTYKDNLLAIGTNLYAYAQENNTWYDRGSLRALDLRATETVRTESSKTNCDSQISSMGIMCTAYTDSRGSHYQITGLSGEVLIPEVTLESSAVLTRVSILGSYFVITYLATISTTPTLRYVAIPIGNLTAPTTPANISSQVDSIAGDYDCVSANGRLYFIWNGSDVGGAVRLTYMSSTLVVASNTVIATAVGEVVAITADNQPFQNIAIAYYESGGPTTNVRVYSGNFGTVLSTTAVSTDEIAHISLVAQDSTVHFFYEVINAYGYDAAINTNYIAKKTISYAGSVSSAAVVRRSLGLASKVLLSNDSFYMLGTYGDPSASSQPSYFFIDGDGNVLTKIAYSNGAGYYATSILAHLTDYGGSFYVSYLFRDQIVAVNKQQGLTGIVNGVYAQNGINSAQLTFNTLQNTAEIGGNLNITGGILWAFDGDAPVEQGFNLWPENVEGTWSATGGFIAAQPNGSTNTDAYFAQFTYEWTDAVGNIHRSAPSIPVAITTTGSGTIGSIEWDVPTLRLTAKQEVRIVGYRWSVAQQNYYQFTSIASPNLNDPTVDYITITDTLPDADILGNPLVYTTGGVVENIASPSAALLTLFRTRLFVLDSEDRNLIWYSKQVIQNTPVEMSDLFTIFVPPTLGSQGSTGDVTALAGMDDKLIIFKRNAIYYVTGIGPDNTGANNDFSDPVYVTSAVGCTNQNSIVLMPQGLMFQSDKGIWLLGRDLSTVYIGAPAQAYNDVPVVSAISIPGTNQVRFTLSDGLTLMYDYFEGQWGTFSGIPAISSVLQNDLHTYLDSASRIFQELPGSYLDGSSPVLMSCQTSWIRLTDLQGFQRAYFVYLLGQYFSPHKLNLSIAYDYEPSASQSVLVTPDNSYETWGSDALWGSSSPWGNSNSIEQARVFFSRQKCQAIQISISEIYDSASGVAAGAGLTLSGLNMVIGSKKGYPVLRASKSYG